MKKITKSPSSWTKISVASFSSAWKNMIVIVILLFNFNSFAQTFDWAIGLGSIDTCGNNNTTADECAWMVDVDNQGNIYVTGSFFGLVDFDPGPNIVYLKSIGSIENNDIFLTKYDSNGNYIWAKNIGNANNDMMSNIKVDNFGNVYLVRYSTGVMTDPPFIAIHKYTLQGDLVWEQRIYNNTFGSVNIGINGSIGVDNDQNIYVVGYFSGTIDFDPGSETANLTSTGGNDIFLAKYDSNGNYVWAKKIGGTGDDRGLSVIIDNSNNPYISAYSNNGLLVAKFNSAGTLSWSKSLSGFAIADYGGNLSIDNHNNILLIGFFQNTVDFDPGPDTANLTAISDYDIFFAKYDSNGNYVWAKSVGGTGRHFGQSITTDGLNNIYITGYFGNSINFDPDANNLVFDSNGSFDIFFAKYDSNGNYVWAKSVGGTGSDRSLSIVVDYENSIIIAGDFNRTVDFDPSLNVANITSKGGRDIFLAKYLDGTTVGVPEKKNKNATIYPNPAQESVMIETTEEIINISCYNLMGKLLLKTQEKTINTSCFSSGIYIVNVETKNGISSQKLIIEK